MSGWQKVTWQILPPTKRGPHKWDKAKSFNWPYCSRCGVIAIGKFPLVKSCNNCKMKFDNLCDGT